MHHSQRRAYIMTLAYIHLWLHRAPNDTDWNWSVSTCTNTDKYFRNQIVGGKYLGDRKKITKGNDGYMNIKCDHETRGEEWKLPPHDISILWRVNYDIFMAVKILFFLYEISWHSSKFIDTLIWKMVLFDEIWNSLTRFDDILKICCCDLTIFW